MGQGTDEYESGDGCAGSDAEGNREVLGEISVCETHGGALGVDRKTLEDAGGW